MSIWSGWFSLLFLLFLDADFALNYALYGYNAQNPYLRFGSLFWVPHFSVRTHVRKMQLKASKMKVGKTLLLVSITTLFESHGCDSYPETGQCACPPAGLELNPQPQTKPSRHAKISSRVLLGRAALPH